MNRKGRFIIFSAWLRTINRSDCFWFYCSAPNPRRHKQGFGNCKYYQTEPFINLKRGTAVLFWIKAFRSLREFFINQFVFVSLNVNSLLKCELINCVLEVVHRRFTFIFYFVRTSKNKFFIYNCLIAINWASYWW